ncbi:MAG: hypothetical protein JKY92_04840 [Magnetovibrio sp.]|nr:hypothetical protein [Magnetovibrio sp.]
MSGSTNQIKCATCNIALAPPSNDPQPHEIVSCPECGVSDTYENIIQEVKEYATEQAGDKLSSMLESTAKKSKIMSFKKERRPKKNYRFIVDLDL